MIEIDGLTFRYPGSASPALNDLTLHVREGSVFGLLGPNGSGKTTLVSILCGLLPIQSGSVRVSGMSLANSVRAVQGVSALVPQEYAFYPSLTVEENLAFFAGVQGLSGRERTDRMSEARMVAGLERAHHRRAATLSGGMKRRLNLAIGLLGRPRILFLDEPTVGIDPQSRAFILDAIGAINKRGTTVIYTSHYMDEVEAVCDRIGVLDDGRLLVQGSLSELLTHAGGRRLRIDIGAPLDVAQVSAAAAFPRLRAEGTVLSLDDCDADEMRRLIDALGAGGVVVTRVRYGEATLEELFLALTRKELRDS